MTLAVSNVSKIFKSKHKETKTLEDINVTINKGEFVCLLGPSGCGKSTLLNLIAGLEKASEGSLKLDGKEITTVGVDRAFLFQESALFPWLRVIDNVEYGMKIAGVPKEERREKAKKYLKMVHLTKFENSFVHELSGGMKQRVALARALSLDSDVLLMDEPFSALDAQTKDILRHQLQKIWFETKKTIVFVTHDVNEAVFLGDRVLVMSANPGKVKKEFKIQLARPRDIDNLDVAYVAGEIMEVLKEEVEKVAKSEYDSDWNIKEGELLYNSDSDLGSGL